MTKQQLGLIGFPLSHSFSPSYFADKFKALDLQDWAYDLFPLEQIADLPRLLASRDNWRGLNVTIPHKEAVIPYLSALSPQAQAVGAVNTIVFEQGQLLGHNTDVLGFDQLLGSAQAQKALILGTGGAAKAVAWVLNQRQIAFDYASRQEGQGLSYAQVDLRDYDWIINTTPLGMYPRVMEAPALNYTQFGPQHWAIDLIYNPSETFFMKQAAERGAKTTNGLPMLRGQAEAAWALWTKKG
jgi:shikimate dehydrogenase